MRVRCTWFIHTNAYVVRYNVAHVIVVSKYTVLGVEHENHGLSLSSSLVALPLRLHGVVKPRAAWNRSENDIFHEYGDVRAFSRRSHGDHGVITEMWRAYGVLVCQCLRSHCAYTACIELSRRAHCADSILFTFGGSWNNWHGPHISAQVVAYDTR